MARNRLDEDFAFEVVGHLLGAQVQPYDVAGRQNAVDAVLHYTDGRDDAVLEVSSIGEQDEARIRNVLKKAGNRRVIPGATRLWFVHVPSDLAPAELELIDGLLLLCERHGLDRFPAQALPLMQNRDALALWGRGVTANAAPAGTDTADLRAYVLVRGVGGFEGAGVEPLVEELFSHLQSPTMQSKIRKLANPLDDGRPRDERHLFLIVRSTAFTFPVYDVLAFGGPLPTRPPRLPLGVSQVWMATTLVAGGIVRAVAGDGWLRDPAWPSLWQGSSTPTEA
jgi:hypothetical protein